MKLPSSTPLNVSRGQREPAEQLVTVEWPHPWGKDVRVTGYFWGWGRSEPLVVPPPRAPTPADNFPAAEYQPSVLASATSGEKPKNRTMSLWLSPGRYEFKFLVDGDWQIAANYDTVPTYFGPHCLNNFIIVQEPTLEQLESFERVEKSTHLESAVQQSSAFDQRLPAPVVVQQQLHQPVNAFDSYAMESTGTTDHVAVVQQLQNRIKELQTENAAITEKLLQSTERETLESAEYNLSHSAGVTFADSAKNGVHEGHVASEESNILNQKLRVAQEEIERLRRQLSEMGQNSKEMERLATNNNKLETRLTEYMTQYAQTTYGLSQEVIDRYRAAFKLFDKDGDGCITTTEIRAAIKTCGLKPNSKWVKELIAEADADGSGTIEWPEFLKAMTGCEEGGSKKTVTETTKTTTTISESVHQQLISQYESAQKEIERLKQDLKNYVDSNTKTRSEYDVARAEIDDLKARLSTANEDVQKLHTVEQVSSASGQAEVEQLNKLLVEEKKSVQSIADKLAATKKELQQLADERKKLDIVSNTNAKLRTKLDEYRTLYSQWMYCLSADEITKYKAVFDTFDKNKNGRISKSELEQVIKECNLTPSTSWIASLMQEADEDNSGTIEWPEFLKAVTRMVQETQQGQPRVMKETVTSVMTTQTSSKNSEELEKVITDLSAKLAEKQTEVESYRSKIKDLETKIVDVSKLQVQHESMKKSNEKLSSKLTEYKSLYARTVYGLTEAQVQKYKTAFDFFDKNHDGRISKEEIAAAIQACGMKPTSKWVESLIREADEDASGTIEWPEFLKAMTGLTEESGPSKKTMSQSETVTTVKTVEGVHSQSVSESNQLREQLSQAQAENERLKVLLADYETKLKKSMEEQRQIIEKVFKSAFPNVELPSETVTYQEWIHDIETRFYKEIKTINKHSERVVKESDKALIAELEHYKLLLAQAQTSLKELEKVIEVNAENYRVESEKSAAIILSLEQKISNMSPSHSIKSEVHESTTVTKKQLVKMQSQLELERKTGQDLSVQAVKLRDMLKTSQSALRREQDHVRRQLSEIQRLQQMRYRDPDSAQLSEQLSSVQTLLEKEMMVTTQLRNKLTSMGVKLTSDL